MRVCTSMDQTWDKSLFKQRWYFNQKWDLGKTTKCDRYQNRVGHPHLNKLPQGCPGLTSPLPCLTSWWIKLYSLRNATHKLLRNRGNKHIFMHLSDSVCVCINTFVKSAIAAWRSLLNAWAVPLPISASGYAGSSFNIWACDGHKATLCHLMIKKKEEDNKYIKGRHHKYH